MGALLGMCLFLIFVVVPRIRAYAFAALVAPFATSIVFLIGALIFADMNPANEYGPSYVPNGTERDPTNIEVGLWLLAVILTLAFSVVVGVRLQRMATEMFQNFWKKPSLTRLDLK
ncbi:MAG: hypothetical protein K2X03_24940 [Bryobacteraceae bacterium]|nr:hypothetical protein [Bryobacteraceae bacterium]